MSEDPDYKDILDGTVDEVKDAVEGLENPDFGELLDLETQGKDRKTLKEFFENRAGAEEVLEEAEEAVDQTDESAGLLENLSKDRVLVGGLALGLLIGLVGGFFAGASGSGTNKVAPSKVAEDVTSLVNVPNTTARAEGVRTEHGLYYVNLSVTQSTGNASRTSYQQVYVSLDNELLIPIQKNPVTGQVISPIPIQQRLQQLQQQNQQPQRQGNSTS